MNTQKQAEEQLPGLHKLARHRQAVWRATKEAQRITQAAQQPPQV